MFRCPYHSAASPPYANPRVGRPAGLPPPPAAPRSLIGGSTPEIDPTGRIYNTCRTFDPLGQQTLQNAPLRHRRRRRSMSRESDTLSPGARSPWSTPSFSGRGVLPRMCPSWPPPHGACKARSLAHPAPSTSPTGPAHWASLFLHPRAHNQVDTLGVRPAMKRPGIPPDANSRPSRPGHPVARWALKSPPPGRARSGRSRARPPGAAPAPAPPHRYHDLIQPA